MTDTTTINNAAPVAQTQGLIASLRALVPKRPLRFSEALRIAELQASRFRRAQGIVDAELPDAVMNNIPRVLVTYEGDLPVSGLTQWHNGRWIVALNEAEPWARQRFTLAHELFHIINHTTRGYMHPEGGSLLSDATRAERLADYFAGVLLMPKRFVKHEVGQGRQTEDLPEIFGVSLRAVTVRLAQLGISEMPRCIRPVNRFDRVTKPYTRALPTRKAAA